MVAWNCDYCDKSYIEFRGEKSQWFNESLLFLHVRKPESVDMFRMWAPILLLPRFDSWP